MKIKWISTKYYSTKQENYWRRTKTIKSAFSIFSQVYKNVLEVTYEQQKIWHQLRVEVENVISGEKGHKQNIGIIWSKKTFED